MIVHTPPVISLAPHHGGFLDTNAGAATLAYSTPSYVSRDVPRSVSLVYNSTQARGLAFLQVDVTESSGAPARTSIQVFRSNGVALTPEVFYGGASGTSRLAASWRDVTSALVHRVVVKSYWADGAVTSAETNARVMVVNEEESRFGSGWTLPGLQRIYPAADGALVTNGDGTAVFFSQGCATCAYQAPHGEFSALVHNTDGTWVRTYPDGGRATFTGTGLIQGYFDRGGHSLQQFAWSGGVGGWAVPTTITDPAGKSFTLIYLGSGYLQSIVDPSGRSSALGYSFADVASIRAPDGKLSVQATYDTSHRLTSYRNRAGGLMDVAYDQASTLASLTAPTVVTTDAGTTRPVVATRSLWAALLPAAGLGTSTAPAPRVDTAAVRVSATDPRGNVTTMAVDRFGAPTRVEQPLGRTTVYARDSLGHVTRSITPSGDMVDYVYTGANLSRTINHRSGKTTELTYNTFNQPLTSSDGDELLENTYETVNGDSRLLTTSVGTEAHAYEYVDDGRLSRALGPGSSVIYRYETTGLQNRSDELGPGGVARYTTYDAAGRPAKLRVSLYPYYTRGDSVRYDYDVLNRTRHQYDPAGNVTTFDYDSVTTRVTDAKGQAYTATTNALGWVVSRRDPGNRVESFGYDRAGNLTSYTNRRGQTVTYGYDELNRLRWRDADGQRTTYDADLAGTVSASANAESVDSVRVTPYDPAAHTAAMTHVSRRAGARYQLQTSSAMDGMLLSVRLNTPGTGYAATYWMGDYGYYNDTARRFRGVCAFASDTDCAITNAFNAPWTHVAYASETGLARAQLIGFAQDTVVSTGDSITYRRATLAETLGVRFTRDGINRVARRTNLAGDSVRAFRYDRMGQLVAWGDTVARITQDCYYDQSLLQEFCRDLPYSEGVKGESFTYDAVGNRTSAGAVLEAGNRLRAYGGFSFDYDADGNLTHKYRTGFDQQLSWNSLGQLVQAVTNGQTATYGYDGGGRRVRKTVNGVVTRYLYNGAHRVADLDGSGNVLAEYTYYPGTDRPHAMRVNGSLYYFLADGPGNVVGLVDAYGSLVNEYRYGPFGEAETVRETVAQPFRFTGRELDAETGLYYFRARYYDPLVGRFVSEDPLGLKAGLNVYAYLGNDPVNGRDPSGMQQSCRIEITRVEGHFDFSANGNPWMRMFGHWECTDSAEPRAGGDFGGAHDCTVTSSCMNQAEELNRITQIQQDQEYANQEPARQRASTAVQSAPYYSPGLADVVGNNLAAWSKVAYPGLTKIAVGGLAAPVAIMAAGGIGTGGAVLEIGAGVNAIPEEAAAIMSEARAIVTSPEMGLLRAAAESGEGLEVTIGQRTVTWTPGWSADYAGHTLGSQNGFGLVGRAMSSSNELVQTVLHELFRLETSTVLSEGATQASVAAETADAWAWAPAALAAGRWLGYW